MNLTRHYHNFKNIAQVGFFHDTMGMYMIAEEIRDLVKNALGDNDADIRLEHPSDMTNGDYSTNVALALGIDANELVKKLQKNLPDQIDRVEAKGHGFINFFLSQKFLTDTVYGADDEFGKSDIGSSKKVVVEYSSPNIAKPFSIGHLRSTVIGDAVANILSYLGYEVIRDNHLGDWGTQFGKQIVAIKHFGDAKNLGGIDDLVNLYIRFHKEAEEDPALEDEAREWFAELEAGNAEARSLWQKCVNLSIREFNKIYERLGVAFDTMLGESFFEDKIAGVLDDIKRAGIAKESEGALLIFFKDDKYPPLMVQKKDGATLYATRDLAADRYRKGKYGPDVHIINEVGSEQTLYFRQLFEAEEMLGYFPKDQRTHVAHGLYRLKEGRMSTRKGTAIRLDDVLGSAVEKARAINKDVAEEVGIGALKYNDLKRESAKDIIFDWDEVLNLDGNSGPYLQYTYARAMSVLQKHDANSTNTLTNDTNNSEIERLIYRFPEVVERAGKDYAPHHICTYLHELAQAFNAYYAQNQIAGNEYRVALTRAVTIILKNGLGLLGIKAPERM